MSKSGKQAPTNDELLAQFDDLGVDDGATQAAGGAQEKSEQDLLAELQDLASQRPTTPRTSSTSNRSPKLASTATPPPGRLSDDKTASRKSLDSSRAYHTSMTPPETTSSEAGDTPTSEEAGKSGGGGWWGGIFATASAAVKQAEAAVKEIKQNEEAQKWAHQVKGNVGALRGLGGELRTLAIPTFTSLLHTLAPPISTHERLQIHITHDLSGYPSLDPLIYSVFSRVMSQVEGGDLLVVQRGREAAPRRGSDSHVGQISTAGWNDGPWWRTVSVGKPRSISAIKGAVVGTKLARASAEAYAAEYFSARGGVEEAAKQASEILSESNPVRSSDIFLAIQAISQPTPPELFQAGPSGDAEKPAQSIVEVTDDVEEEVFFALYLHDPIHSIAFHAVTQPVPQKWIDWLDAPTPDHYADNPNDVVHSTIPEAIAEIIESGGVDPREWVAEWIEEALTLGVGVVAQRYVARRMGVGEGGVGRGKMKAEQATAVESGAGEAARAL
ncbi:hypothetical protein AJ78_07830 [Emergomyces pasteurianus Ep9510]|uniref:Maintenance of telomere capping protein 1 n=1 Tax=Emergomyces pasteurianus Ep9510 TaxID=1447872 RepID=A0A1J9PU51_9EURO|nr:hypothetical protein AJ78_07830 [Emergomyces pasteurianus Ep9510]